MWGTWLVPRVFLVTRGDGVLSLLTWGPEYQVLSVLCSHSRKGLQYLLNIACVLFLSIAFKNCFEMNEWMNELKCNSCSEWNRSRSFQTVKGAPDRASLQARNAVRGFVKLCWNAEILNWSVGCATGPDRVFTVWSEPCGFLSGLSLYNADE